MRRNTAVISAIAAVITMLAIAATPAFAAGGMMGHQGLGRGPGEGLGSASATTSGTLTSSQRSTLAAMADEEKLAHDVYVALGARYPEISQFNRIATAELRHLWAVRRLLARYAVADPTQGTGAGDFASASFQAMYDDLTASATTGAKALAAGVSIERLDIADLTSAMSGLTAPDVLRVYAHLRQASQNHLAAFSR